MAEKKNEKKVRVLNQGHRNYQLSGKRVLKPGQALEVSGKEAKLLLGQRDIVDAAKVVPPSEEDKDMKAENAKLKAENAKLKAVAAKGAAPALKVGDEVELKDGSRALVGKVKDGKATVKDAKGKSQTLGIKELKKVA